MRRGENASPDGASSPQDVHLSGVAFRSAQSTPGVSGNSMREGTPVQLSELGLSGALASVSAPGVWSRQAEEATQRVSGSGVCFDSEADPQCEDPLQFSPGEVAKILHSEPKPVPPHVRGPAGFGRMSARCATADSSNTKAKLTSSGDAAPPRELRRQICAASLKAPFAAKTWSVQADHGDEGVGWEGLAASQSGLLQSRQFHGLAHPGFGSAGLKAPPGLASPALPCGFSGFNEAPVQTRANAGVDAERQCLDLLLGADLLSSGYFLGGGGGGGASDDKFKIADLEGASAAAGSLSSREASFLSSSREAPWACAAAAAPERTELPSPSPESRMRQMVEVFVSQLHSVVVGNLHNSGGRDGRRGRRKEHESVLELSILVGQLYTPWCSRKQILDPELMGAAHLRRVADDGAGHSDVVQQLQDLRSCVSSIVLVAERTDVVVTETGSLTCDVRGTVLLRPPPASRASDAAGVKGSASSASASGPADPPNRVGRFVQCLSLSPVGQTEPSSACARGESTGAAAARALGRPGPQFPFVVESEIFALLADRPSSACSPNWELGNTGAASHGAGGIANVSSTNIKAGVGFQASRSPQSSRPVLSVEPLGHSYLSDISAIGALFESFGLMRNAYSAPSVSDASAALGLSGEGGVFADNVACMPKELLSKTESGALHTERQPTFNIPFDVREKLVRQQERKPKKTNRQRIDRRRQPLLTTKEMAALELHLQNLSVGRDRVQGITSSEPTNRIPHGDTSTDLCAELKGSGSPNSEAVTEVSVSRTIFVSWIPRAARADSLAWKDEREDTVCIPIV